MKYLVVIEKMQTRFAAYSPDLPGCVTTETTQQETTKSMEEAISFHVVSFHIEGLQLEGEPIPTPSSTPTYIEAAVA